MARKPSGAGWRCCRAVSQWSGPVGEWRRRGCSWATVFTQTHRATEQCLSRAFSALIIIDIVPGALWWGITARGRARVGGRRRRSRLEGAGARARARLLRMRCVLNRVRVRFSQARRTDGRTSGAGRRQRRRLRLPRYKVTVYTYIPRRRRRRLHRTRAPAAAAAAAAESWTPVCFQRWTGTRSRNRSKTCATSPQWTDGRYPGAYRREYTQNA